MLAPSTARAAARSPSTITLPSFLVPALASAAATPARRAFSVSASQQSKLGRTPITIPPGVELTIGEPYIIRDYTTYKQTPRRNVSVAGPLGRWPGHEWGEMASRLGSGQWLTGCTLHTGKLDLNVPPFVNLDFDGETRKLVLTIQDRMEKKQREMWGAFELPHMAAYSTCEHI